MKRKNSFFGDKSSQLIRSRESSREESDIQEQMGQVTKSLSLQVPEVKKPVKIYVKRTFTNDVSGALSKKEISTIS